MSLPHNCSALDSGVSPGQDAALYQDLGGIKNEVWGIGVKLSDIITHEQFLTLVTSRSEHMIRK